MNEERTRGAVLYAGAAVVLALGGVWWVRAAPPRDPQADVDRWRGAAERRLPADAEVQAVDTLALDAGTTQHVTADVGNGYYQVSMVCEGGPRSEVRVRMGADDSGRGLNCTGNEDPDSFTVGVAGALRMIVSVGDNGTVVFRYLVTRAE